FGGSSKLFAVSNLAQLEKVHDSNGISRRFSAVIIFFDAQDQIGGIGGALPESAILSIVKFSEHRFGEIDSKFQVLRLEGGLIQVNDTGEEKSVTFQQLDLIALAVAPAVIESFGARIP